MIKTRVGLADDTNGEHHEEQAQTPGLLGEGARVTVRPDTDQGSRIIVHLEELICTFFVPLPEPLDSR